MSDFALTEDEIAAIREIVDHYRDELLPMLGTQRVDLVVARLADEAPPSDALEHSILTARSAAAKLGIPLEELYRRVDAGDVTTLTVGGRFFFRVEDLEVAALP